MGTLSSHRYTLKHTHAFIQNHTDVLQLHMNAYMYLYVHKRMCPYEYTLNDRYLEIHISMRSFM